MTTWKYATLERDEDGGRKFWSVNVIGKRVEVRQGKAGLSGRKSHKQLDDHRAATKYAEGLVDQRLLDGWILVDTSSETAKAAGMLHRCYAPAPEPRRAKELIVGTPEGTTVGWVGCQICWES